MSLSVLLSAQNTQRKARDMLNFLMLKVVVRKVTARG